MCVCCVVQSLHAVDVHTLIQFLPTLFNQLFRLMVQTSNDDVSSHTTRCVSIYRVMQCNHIDESICGLIIVTSVAALLFLFHCMLTALCLVTSVQSKCVTVLYCKHTIMYMYLPSQAAHPHCMQSERSSEAGNTKYLCQGEKTQLCYMYMYIGITHIHLAAVACRRAVGVHDVADCVRVLLCSTCL